MEMNEGRPEMHVMPDSKELVAQYLLLYSMSGDPDDFVDVVEPDYRMANVRVQLQSDHYADVKQAIAAVQQAMRTQFPDRTVQVNLAGQANNSYTIINLVLSNQIQNVIFTIVMVFLITSLIFHSWAAGAFCAAPTVVATVVNFGIMGYFGITLGVITAMTADIGIGVGVDYAIHFVNRYRLLGRRYADPLEVTRHTMVTAGKAIFFNALVVGAGFAVLLVSHFPLHSNLGLLVALNMGVSCLAAMTILPALMNWVRPAFVYGTQERGDVEPRLA
jgi:predicted RND superfamily exporter protein